MKQSLQLLFLIPFMISCRTTRETCDTINIRKLESTITQRLQSVRFTDTLYFLSANPGDTACQPHMQLRAQLIRNRAYSSSRVDTTRTAADEQQARVTIDNSDYAPPSAKPPIPWQMLIRVVLCLALLAYLLRKL